MSIEVHSAKEGFLPEMQGSLINDLILEDNEKGNVIVKNSPAAKTLGLKEGDELAGATIFFDKLNKDEVMNIIKSTKPYKVGLKLHSKDDLKSPDYNLSSPDFNLRTPDTGVQMSSYERIFNKKIKPHLTPSTLNAKGNGGHIDLKGPRVDGFNLKDPNLGTAPDFNFGVQERKLKIPKLNNSSYEPDIDMGVAVKTPDVVMPVLRSSDAEVNFPEASLKGPGIKIKSNDISGPKVKGIDIHTDRSLPHGNLDAPSLKIRGDVPEPTIDMPDIDLEVPDRKVKKPKFKSPFGMSRHKGNGLDLDIDTNLKSPDISVPDVDVPNININGPQFKMPSIGGKTHLKGPEGDFDVAVNKPKVRGGIDVPDVELPDADVKGKKSQMPSSSFSGSGPNASMPNVDIDMKSPTLKGGTDFSVPKLKGDVKTPDLSLKGPKLDGHTPDINIEGPESKIKFPTFKKPTFRVKAPNIEGPEGDLDIAISKPKVKGGIDVPDVELPDANVKDKKFKMSFFNWFKSKPTTPEIDADMKSPDLNSNIDFSIPKLKGDVKSPNIDVKGPKLNADTPEINIEGPESKIQFPSMKKPTFGLKTPNINVPEGDLDVGIKKPNIKGGIDVPDVELPDANIKGKKFQMPSFNFSGPNVSTPDLDIDMKSPTLKGDTDFSVPKLKGDVKTPDLSLKGPKLDGRTPDISIEGPESKTRFPNIKLPSFGLKTPNVDVPEVDLDVGIKKPNIKGGIDVPGVELPDTNIKGKKFRMPSLNFSGPNVSTPDVDIDMKSPTLKGGADFPVPKLKGDIKTPDLSLRGPKLDGHTPDISTEGPESKIKFPTFKKPTFRVKAPNIEGPEGDLDIGINKPNIKGGIDVPDVELPDANIKGKKFRMPSLNFSGPNVSTPDVDIDMKSPTLKGGTDFPVPKLKGDIKTPDLSLKGPKLDGRTPDISIEGLESKIKLPTFKKPTFQVKAPNIEGPEGDLDIGINKPKVRGGVNVPNMDTDGPAFKMPSFNSSGSQPNISAPGMDITGPSFKGDIGSTDIDMKKHLGLPGSALDSELKLRHVGSEFDVDVLHPTVTQKMKSGLGVFGPDVEGESTDLGSSVSTHSGHNSNLGTVDAETENSSNKCPKFPAFEREKESVELNTNGQGTTKSRGFSPKFEFPSVGFSLD
nr:PREDICTED: neuroblast differentiation-associated protein AHNAK-like [Latimeria chalumnae]|eukprot:XP_005994018.1 PREDICTED: neuroblast differentiation-associated protein AHNAK-like [Latimeria chalumnae]